MLACSYIVVYPIEKVKATEDNTEIYPSDDTYVIESSIYANMGYYPELQTRGQVDENKNIIIKFDLSEINAVNKATLTLYYFKFYESDPVGHELCVHRVTSDWEESIVVWNTHPTYTPDITDCATVPASIGYISWDVTEDVEKFIEGIYPNYGWVIDDISSDSEATTVFYSKEGTSNYSLKPRLEISIADIYVDDDASPDWYDSTHVKTIQEGINNASNDETILVYNGTYYENVIIDKTVNLCGENKNSVIIDADGISDVVYISANYVNISKFTLKNSGSSAWPGRDAGIDIISSNCAISNIIFSNNDFGVYAEKSTYNNVVNSTFVDNRWATHFYDEGHDNIISDNTFIQNTEGAVYLWNVESSTISENTINTTLGFGIVLIDSDNNYIGGNNIFNNRQGICLNTSSDNIISGNDIIENTDDGINLLNSAFGNVITNNYIYKNADDGVQLYNSCNNNIIIENIIDNNYERGIQIQMSSNNNEIFHNKFQKNIENAFDECTNVWDKGSMSGGNYWDDYTGSDDDGDGLGDTPYDIEGGPNQDLHPLMHLWGENPPVANFTYFGEDGNIDFDASGSYDRDGEIISYEWDLGDGTYQAGVFVNHKYCNNGTYDVTLTVEDDDGNTGEITRSIIIDDVFNLPPSAPLINGPLSGRPWKKYSYMFLSEDPDDDEVSYEILWGDGTTTGWIGPYDSDVVIMVNHTWTAYGKYVIMARARDDCFATSDWKELQIAMPRERTINNLLLRFLQSHPNLFPIIRQLLNL